MGFIDSAYCTYTWCTSPSWGPHSYSDFVKFKINFPIFHCRVQINPTPTLPTVAWNSVSCFNCSVTFSSSSLPWEVVGKKTVDFCCGIFSTPWHPDPLSCTVEHFSLLLFLQMPQQFCTLGCMQRSNSHDSVLGTAEQGKCHQRSPQSSLTARMKWLPDRWLIKVSRRTHSFCGR